MTIATANKARAIALALTTALATTTLSGCIGKVAPSSASSLAKAETAISKGKGNKAVAYAEAAVLADPRNAETRSLLAKAYIEAGRFASAATAFDEAMQLGDVSGRTILMQALTLSAGERFSEAQTLLDRYERNLDPADFGLAITVAGRPQQGIQVLSNVLRSGVNTMQVRQNLAYAFALNGDWRSARLVAQQDLAADALAKRMGQWAVLAQPQMNAQRVAALLETNVSADSGQPAQLALANFPTPTQLALAAVDGAETAPTPPVEDDGVELAAIAPSEPVAAITTFDVEKPAPVAVSRVAAAPRIVLPKPTPVRASDEVPAKPVVAARPKAATPSKAFAAAFIAKPGDYMIQLGSFASAAIADDAWARMQKRHPELKGADKSVTKAKVDGKIYYRVAASGFAKSSAVEVCGIVKKRGGGCFSYAGTRTLPGSIADATRVATR